jgi:preprotein translocase subunit SecA
MAETRPWWERALAFSERRRVKALTERGNRIADLEPDMEKLSDNELRGKTAEFRTRFENGETLDQLLPEAFAAVREAGKRTLEMRHFDVQMVGGIALHEGAVAEMLTGEGKTLVATLPLYLNALSGNNVHLVTANDYLAKRDAQWMAPIYEALGMKVGWIENQQGAAAKRDAYAANITYGTNSEFGFDYLRDNMAFSLDEIQQRGHFFAIVDEADSILIDEARTPLIISGQPEEAAETYFKFAKIIAKMEPEKHFEFDEKMHTAHATEEGVSLTERELGIPNLYLAENNQLINHLNQAIRARALYHRDKEYVVVDDEVKIVDEHTGRIMEGRRWSEGLHQAVEAKEGVRPQEENVTVASITIQNYFRLYEKLAGMTGTADTEAAELKEIYGLDVVQVPPNRPVQRLDMNDYVFKNERGKYTAIVRDIKERHEKGQPVLVGTIAVEKSEALSDELTRQGVPHEVLNAKQHEREGQIIMDAGQAGAVTIATNMAGRGVDIKLGEGVRELGGLFVLGTERHESRRIDNQLRGRSGRQGDPGETRFYLSSQDDLVRIFAGDRMERILGRFNSFPDDEPLDSGLLTRTIKNAQKRVEERNFIIRKNVLKYDDVLNTQRAVIYEQRRAVLDGRELREDIVQWLEDEIQRIVDVHTPSPYPEEWELEEMLTVINGQLFQSEVKIENLNIETLDREDLIDGFVAEGVKAYEAREEKYGPELLREVERHIFLQVLDTRWREHLDNMDYLRDGIGLRGLAQKDPLSEYRGEGYEMFLDLQESVKSESLNLLMHVEIEATAMEPGDETESEDEAQEQSSGNGSATGLSMGNSWASTGQLNYSAGGGPSALEEMRAESGEGPSQQTTTVQQRKVEDKVGRNDPCPCGSGKKYKNCHGAA